MKGYELYEEVFKDIIESDGELEPSEIEYLDEVTCYDERLSYNDGWYNVTEITFRYNGKKYSLERKDHTSDNVADTTYLFEGFHEVVASSELDKAIDKVIEGIESQTFDTLEEIVVELESIKRKFYYINE